MGLKLKEIRMDCGIKIQNAYFRIRFVSYDSINHRINYNGEFYVSENARQSGEVQSLPAMFLDDYFASEEKSANLFELAYNNIKAISAKLKENGTTLEDIIQHNDSVFEKKGVDGQLMNPLYYYFIDAEDC